MRGEDFNKVIGKIQKCLALSKSSNPNEAETALRQAHALMKKHKISLDEAELGELVQKTTLSKYTSAKHTMLWLSPLVYNISLFCNSYGYVVFHSTQSVEKAAQGRISNIKVNWIGSDSAVEISDYYFNFIYRQINLHRKKYIEKIKADFAGHKLKRSALTELGNNYVLGMVIELIDKLKELTSESDTADYNKLEAIANNKFKDNVRTSNDTFKRKEGKTGALGRSAIMSGSSDAEAIRISKGVHGTASPTPLSIEL